MLKTHNALLRLVAVLTFGSLASSAYGVEPVDGKQLKLGNLARLEESAQTPADYRQIARLYELRAEMLEQKVVRHLKLEKRYAAAPASLLAKRGTAWNTPTRQRKLARTAQHQAQAARQAATEYLAKADFGSLEVD